MVLPIPTFEMMGGCSSCNSSNVPISFSLRGTSKEEKTMTHRMFPQDEVARILQRDVLHPPHRLCSLALLDLATMLVLLLLRPDLGERDRDVLRELESRTMKGTSVGFVETGLVL
jgi:hypothetical protein